MTAQFGTDHFTPAALRAARGQLAYLSGRAAEERVADDYLARGYVRAETRWRGKRGELDLIFADGDGFVFVEVKKSRTFARAAERLRAAQMGRLFAAAEEYLAHRGLSLATDLRFDLALVDGKGAVKVLENALADF
ncbi:MAG: YraN family protein [Thalassovita sp.]|nr:YraN family protein [Thalassovita sp.]